MPQAFLSYSHVDSAAASELRELLRATGIDVFKDDASIRVGDKWVDRLEGALSQCASFIVLVGRDGITRWVGAETQVALARHIGARGDALRLPILPLLLADTSPAALPPFLSLFQAEVWAPGQPLPDGLRQVAQTSDARFESRPELRSVCPYLGLAAFRLEHSHLFFGRTKETLEALRGLGDMQQTNPEQLSGGAGKSYRRWLQIEGSSGSGKSSLVQAGMLPMIERGALWPRTGYATWRVLGPMMPGRDPLTNLSEAIELGLKPDAAARDIAGLAARLKQADDSALALTLRNFKDKDTALLLVVDQFEELFTFAEPAQRRHLDALLAHALRDPECPLFMISTVRSDFLDRIEQLACLSEMYNSHCERYLLPLITQDGLREAIEMPARLAGLDVSEVTAAIVADARDEAGALPLVENALRLLWNERQGNRLSGRVFEERGKLAGMLRTGADALLDSVERALPGQGRKAALELLLALTRVNPDGRHTRQRITREEAVLAAGGGRDDDGERALRMLSGERRTDMPSQAPADVLRLVSAGREREADVAYVDLIHETLIRSRGRSTDGKPMPYWPALYDFIEKNRDRDVLRQQLKLQVERWQASGRTARWFRLAGWRQLLNCRRLRIPKASADGRFLSLSRRKAALQGAFIAVVMVPLAESAWWTWANNLPLEYIGYQLRWWAGFGPIPQTVPIQPGEFTMGCKIGRDDVEGAKCKTGQAVVVRLKNPCAMGEYEVTFQEYDYYRWSSGAKGRSPESFPGDARFGRIGRPVINVSWNEAQAYVKWLRDKTGQPWRLPTESEWEYAARAGTDTAFWWGREAGKGHANCSGCDDQFGDKKTAPVGSYAPNPWGLYDTAGNVWEWVEDAYEPGDEAKADGDGQRVLRGGSWGGPRGARAADRRGGGSAAHNGRFGFRVCRGSPFE
jgi:hypothetical protein